MTPAIHHVDLLMSDYHATERFYREVLGWPIIRRSGKGAEGWVDFIGEPPADVEPLLLAVQLAGGAYLAFVKGRAPDYREDEPHIAVRITDPGALLERLASHRVPVEVNPGENMAFYDPSGLRIEVYEE
ncbi:MAG TPA: VOC family protein [Candidatus Thermoplasmatota archaeon]